MLISGGISVGDYDFVKEALEYNGAKEIFYKVNQKPGKPLWFGRTDRTLVFGLPGNPVSVIACFEIFVRRALAWMQGREDDAWTTARLAQPFQQRARRAVLHPAQRTSAGVVIAPWFGSPDLRSVTQADGFVLLPAGPTEIDTIMELPALWGRRV